MSNFYYIFRFSDFDPNRWLSMFVNFSAQTSAGMTQDIIDGKLGKVRRGVYGPPTGKKMIVMVDDLNMPAKEEYGAQPPIEILRQWMDHGGWYDLVDKERSFRNLVEIQFVAAMGPPGGGKTRITQRYVRHFNMLHFTPYTEDSLRLMFTTTLDWVLGAYPSKLKSLSGSIVEATLEFYHMIQHSLLPTPAKSHYTFNLRDLAKVFQGMAMSSSSYVKETTSSSSSSVLPFVFFV